MLLKITMAILLQGLTLCLLGLSCEATSLGMSVIVEPLEDTEGSMVRAHFTAIVPNPCPHFTGVCLDGEDCEAHLTSTPFTGDKPESGWCARQWYKTVSSDFKGTITLGSNTEIYVSMNAGPVIRPNNGKLNQPPYVCLPPPLRARVSCPHHIHLSVRDTDGDMVRCRFANETQGECLDCAPHSFIELEEGECTLTFDGNAAEGQYFIYLMAEDRTPAPSLSQITLSEPLSAVPVHLSLSVEAFNGRCSDEPVAQPTTPAENAVFDILPFQQVKFPVAFVSQTERILEVAVVGPYDLRTADFTSEGTLAIMNIARVRHVNNNKLPRLLPISYVANTESLQSEPRCVWLKQTTVATPPLGTELECADTQMTLALPLASLTDIDLDDLRLNDLSCPIIHNSTHLMAQISFYGCDTEVVYAESEMIFFNLLRTKISNTMITRKSILELPLACRIPAVHAGGPYFQMEMPTENETFGEVKVWIDIEIPDMTARRGREVESAAQRFEALDVHVMASSLADRAEITVSDCIESETADFAQSHPIVENGCMTASNIVEMPSASSTEKTYRLALNGDGYEGSTMYIRCTINLCLPTKPSKNCPDLCNNKASDDMVITSLVTRNYVVESGPISLVVTTPAPSVTPTTTTTTTATTSHAAEQASTMAAGVILTTISILLQNLFLY